jgi:hypothetical protein
VAVTKNVLFAYLQKGVFELMSRKLIPDILLPYYQNTVSTLIRRLNERMIQPHKSSECRQLLRFYEKRFLLQLNAVIMVFRSHGWQGKIPDSLKEKAMKGLEMISSLDEATFLQRFRDQFHHHFMARFAH